MIVMKFGGTSVGSPRQLQQVIELVRSRLDRRPLVIVSAHSGMTDLLVQAARAALQGEPDVGALAARQLSLMEELGLPERLVRDLLDNLQDLLKGVSLLEELTPRTMDQIYSFGERMSVRVVAAALEQAGVPAEAFEAYNLGLRTDATYGDASPDEQSYPVIRDNVGQLDRRVPVVTGFIGKCPDGHITTLGRGGSDYSATIFAAAVGAEEVEIWTDVNGVMTSDPRICPQARNLPALSFSEAAELAWYGAKVLHPRSIQPAVERGIPVRVLNTFAPDQEGTVILPQPQGHEPAPRSIAYKKDITLVNITSSRMLGSHGFLARVFHIFDAHEVVTHMVATAEVSVSITTDMALNRLEPALRELRKIGQVDAADGKALVCVVGEGMSGVRGVASRVFDAFRDADVNVEMISQGTREINIATLIENGDVEAAVQGLHRAFFE